ncbi:MAG: regulatory protein RecX [Gemmatimonadota bacterium]
MAGAADTDGGAAARLATAAATAADGQAEEARQLALQYLASRDRTEQELRQRLTRRGCAAPAIDAAMERLVAARLVNDEALARRYVEGRMSERPAGAPRLALDLRRRGVGRTIIDRVLAEFAGRIGTEEAAADLLRRVAKRYRGLDSSTARRRMYGMLARRGFDPETTARAVEIAWREMAEA